VNLNIYGNVYNLGEPTGQRGSTGLNAVATGPGTIAVFNNTIFNASVFFLMGSSVKGGKVIFSDNIAASTIAGNAMTIFGANVASDHNCFFTSGEPVFSYSKKKFSSLETYQRESGLDRNSVFSDPQFLSAVPITPLDFRINLRSGCNSSSSTVPSVDAATGLSYDHDHEISGVPIIGALRVDTTAGHTGSLAQSCTSQCFEHRFVVPNGVYLVAVKFAPSVVRQKSEIGFILNGRKIVPEFEPSAPGDSNIPVRNFLVRPDNASIMLEPDTNTDTSVVTGVDILPFDTSHGDRTQVISW
jgi:hypothetical protein